MDGREDEDEVGNNGIEQDSVSSDCEKMDILKTLKLRHMTGMANTVRLEKPNKS
jgi:hypothetical protein